VNNYIVLALEECQAMGSATFILATTCPLTSKTGLGILEGAIADQELHVATLSIRREYHFKKPFIKFQIRYWHQAIAKEDNASQQFCSSKHKKGNSSRASI